VRAKGTVLFDDTLVSNPVVDEAKKRQRQKQEESRARAAERADRPVPNYVAYSFLFPNYDPKTGKGAPSPLPKCRRCREATLFPTENHVCEGFKPMYVERTPEEWQELEEQRRERQRERWEEQREMIREAKRNGLFFSEADEDEPEEDWCEEDPPEEDWCDEDDGDPMWE
jgi:hypothetical protein